MIALVPDRLESTFELWQSRLARGVSNAVTALGKNLRTRLSSARRDKSFVCCDSDSFSITMAAFHFPFAP